MARTRSLAMEAFTSTLSRLVILQRARETAAAVRKPRPLYKRPLFG